MTDSGDQEEWVDIERPGELVAKAVNKERAEKLITGLETRYGDYSYEIKDNGGESSPANGAVLESDEEVGEPPKPSVEPDGWLDDPGESYKLTKYRMGEGQEQLFSKSTIQDRAERFCEYLEHTAKDELSEKERRQLENIKSNIRDFAEVFSQE